MTLEGECRTPYRGHVMKTLIIVIANEVKQSPPKGRWSGCYLGVMRLLLSTQDLAMTARGECRAPIWGSDVFFCDHNYPANGFTTFP